MTTMRSTRPGHFAPVPIVAPWAVAAGMGVSALPVRFVLAADQAYAWAWSPLTLTMYGGITYVVHRATKHLATSAHGKTVHQLAVGGAAVAGGWSWVLGILPDLTWRPFAAYGMAAFTAAAAANVLFASRTRPAAEEGGKSGMSDRLARALADVRDIKAPHEENGTIVADIVAEPGASIADLQKNGVAATLESVHDLPPGSAQIIPGKPGTSTRVGTLRMSPVDHLATPPPWPGIVSTGTGTYGFGTIMDPIVIGRRQSGRPLAFHLPGDAAEGRNAALLLITGMSGAGKSEGIRKMLVTLMSRGAPAEVEYWYLNPRKFDQEPAWVAKGAARTADSKAGVKALLRELEAEMPGRAKLLGEAGYEQWAPGAPVPYRWVVIDEFAAVAKDVERVAVDLSETLRSLGVGLALGLQRATFDRLPTSMRANLNLYLCYGVEDADDATYALPEDVVDALGEGGPHVWGAEKPGACYLAGVGIDKQLQTEPGRTYDRAPDLLVRWAEHLIALRAGQTTPTPLPASTMQTHTHDDPDGDDGLDLDDEDLHDDDEDDGGLLAAVGEDASLEDLDGDASDLLREALEDLDDEDEEDSELEQHTVPDDLADIHDLDGYTISDDDCGMQLALQPRMDDHQARAHLRDHLRQLAAHSADVRPGDIAEDVLSATGMKASWLSKWLGAWADDPADDLLRRGDGRGHYLLNPRTAITASD
ncbi:hypothetical protein GCM10010124_26340 [Pilimelia terevasa]|uniref:FtsK domain-containing protein n=1 Tax=Pilimelia terevasa TaxID=53372 RepID=A0A8J3BMI3_9ACTN|nr:FtsK/SpoIIIE domain-containing protein [Pilimelia terevasa]GGK32291.1 hypothetical protein GCM10010124_26340 [Pilimelia terevasa]